MIYLLFLKQCDDERYDFQKENNLVYTNICNNYPTITSESYLYASTNNNIYGESLLEIMLRCRRRKNNQFVKQICQYNYDALNKKDSVNGLFPFMQILSVMNMAKYDQLDIGYMMLRNKPEVIMGSHS